MSERKHKRREVTCFLFSRVFRSFGELLEHKDRVHANGPTYACPLCRFNGPTRGMVWEKHVQREHAAQIVKYRLKREDVTTVTQRPFLTESSARSRPLVSNKRRSSSVESRETEGSIGPDPDFSISAPDHTEAYDQENHGLGGQTPEERGACQTKHQPMNSNPDRIPGQPVHGQHHSPNKPYHSEEGAVVSDPNDRNNGAAQEPAKETCATGIHLLALPYKTKDHQTRQNCGGVWRDHLDGATLEKEVSVLWLNFLLTFFFLFRSVYAMFFEEIY